MVQAEEKNNFKGLIGLLNGFKDRNGKSFIAVCDESGAVYTDSANDWIVTWYAILMTKMFNFDKTGLLFTSALLTKQWLSKNKLAVEENIAKKELQFW